MVHINLLLTLAWLLQIATKGGHYNYMHVSSVFCPSSGSQQQNQQHGHVGVMTHSEIRATECQQ